VGAAAALVEGLAGRSDEVVVVGGAGANGNAGSAGSAPAG
jgi:hypothetical protein